MKILDEIMDAMGIVDEVEEEVPHKSLEERNAARAERAEKKHKPVETEEETKESATDKLKNFFKKKEEAAEEEAPQEEQKTTTGKRRLNFNFTKKQGEDAPNQVVKQETAPKSVDRAPAHRAPALPFNAGDINMQLINPTSFDDSQKIADCLNNNQPVIINFEHTDPIIAKRMTDFISGTIYALQGNMKKIGRNILICAPKNIDIDSELLLEDRGREPWQE